MVIRKKVQKNLRKIDRRYKERVLIALVKLRSEPYLGKPLLGDLEGCFSLRIWPYRIIYRVYENKLIVYVIEIAHRQEAYK